MSPEQRISRTLYRQYLRWCQDIPSSLASATDGAFGAIVRSVQVESPEQVDAYRFASLRQWNATTTTNTTPSTNTEDDTAVLQRVHSMLPPSTVYYANKDKMRIPIRSVADARNVIRALFRLNHVPDDDDDDEPSTFRNDERNKQRRDDAFAKLRYMNELRDTQIRQVQERHERNKDRTGVKFHIGQVVQHGEKRWRGVVVDWTKQQPNDGNAVPPTASSIASSLTGKNYKSLNPTTRYSLILDDDDADFLQGKGQDITTTTTDALETELQPVTDPYLTRLRNDALSIEFERYDANSHTFVAFPLKQYEYPSDNHPPPRNLHHTTAAAISTQAVCTAIMDGVKTVAGRLVAILLENSKTLHHPRSQPSTTGLWRLLKRIEEGKIFPSDIHDGDDEDDDDDPMMMMTSKNPQLSLLFLASQHVRALTEVTERAILDPLTVRRFSLENRPDLKFRVGDVVWHTKFHFRGVVVAWDVKPVIDVSFWDGLQDVENADELPFYQIVPDQEDCIAAFGGRRGMRYVCEANLEICRSDRLDVDIDLGVDWQFDADAGEPHFVPPVRVRFKQGEDIDDGGLMDKTMHQLEKEINAWQLQSRENGKELLSVDNLLKLLGLVESSQDSFHVREMLMNIKKAYPDLQIRHERESAVSALAKAQPKITQKILALVVEAAPNYADAWGSLGSLHLLNGNLDEAQTCIEKALVLDPSHCAAMKSMGVLLWLRSDFEKAILQFRRCLDLDPWSPAGDRLSSYIDYLERRKADEEESD